MKSYCVTIIAEIDPEEFSSPRQVAGIVAVKLETPSIHLNSVSAEELETGQSAKVVIRAT